MLGPGNIVKTAILPGKEESLDFNRVRFRHCQNIIMKPVPGKIVETAILPGIYKSAVNDVFRSKTRLFSIPGKIAICTILPGNG